VKRERTILALSLALALVSLTAPPIGAQAPPPPRVVLPTAFKFNGKIGTITVELKDVKTAEQNQDEEARRVARLKKSLSD
jgi:hypothetical protein